MRFIGHSSQTGSERRWPGIDRLRCWGTLIGVLCTIQHVRADDLQVRPSSPQSLAFARYIASLEGRNPFAEAGPVAVLIEASLPELYKQAALLAIRQRGEHERSEYVLLGMQGDGTVTDEVTARFFALEQELEAVPLSSILITPANYRFRFRGEVKTGRDRAYVYDITPKKPRTGMVSGQIWIDAESGAEVMVNGHLADTRSVGSSVKLVREMKLQPSGYIRVTHLSFGIPLLGRSELIVAEHSLCTDDDAQSTQCMPMGSESLAFQSGLLAEFVGKAPELWSEFLNVRGGNF